MTQFKTEADLPADVYSQFYEEVSANPEGAMLFIANWAYRNGRDSLRELSNRWQEVINAPGFAAAVEVHARHYHDSACIYQRELDALRATIREARAEAWEEGLADSINADLGSWEEPPSIPANPYRKEA